MVALRGLVVWGHLLCGEGRRHQGCLWHGFYPTRQRILKRIHSLGSGVSRDDYIALHMLTAVSRKQKPTLHCAIEKYHLTQYVHVMERNTSLFSKTSIQEGVIMRSLYCYVSKEGIFIVYIKDFQRPPHFSFIPKNQASFAPCGRLRLLRKIWVYQ